MCETTELSAGGCVKGNREPAVDTPGRDLSETENGGTDMKKTMTALACAALILALILGLAGCGAATSVNVAAPETQPGITVSASASVRLVPDKASVTFAVTTQGDTAQQAQQENAESVNRVMDVLTERGIEEKSIRTQGYDMYPLYDWSEDGDQRIIGYDVTTTMTVQDQNIEDLGSLLSACVEAGINDIDYVKFLCSGYDEAYLQALAEAIKEAKAEAEALAAASGKKLGDPITITEGYQDTSARYGKTAANAPMADEADYEMAAVVFQPGETEITANVTVTYGMK